MRYLLIKIFILLALFVNVPQTFSQGISNKSVETIEPASIDKDAWKSLGDDLEFIEREEVKNVEIGDYKVPEWLSAIFTMLMYLMIIVAVLLVAYVLMLIFQGAGWETPLSLRIKNNVKREYLVEDLSHESPLKELTDALEKSLSEGDFRATIRIQYLIVIRNLISLRLIRWRKNKTNFDYIHELKSGSLKSKFVGLTYDYERVWYGEQNLDENRRQSNYNRYKNIIDLINNTPNQ
ncbi:MAG: hypothetical protein ABFR62_08100 [Bacteroidota bacterium]